MPSKEQAVQKINKKTHEEIKAYAKMYGESVPKLLDEVWSSFKQYIWNNERTNKPSGDQR